MAAARQMAAALQQALLEGTRRCGWILETEVSISLEIKAEEDYKDTGSS